MTRFFTKDHEWIEISGDVGTVGITNFAQAQLGDITFVEAPQLGATLKQSATAAVVDSVKAASDVYAPVSGVVVSANAALEDAPELVNSHAESADGDGGWLFKLTVTDPKQLTDLMDQAAYDAHIAGL